MPKYRFQCSVCESIETVFISMSETLEDCIQCDSKGSMNKLFDKFFSEVKRNTEHKVGNITKDYIENPGPKCDGVHVVKKGAIMLINGMKKTSSPAPAGPATPDKAQKKPKHANKTSSPGSGANDPKNPLSAQWQQTNKDLLKKIYEKELQKYESAETAKKFLLERSKAFFGEAAAEIDPYLNRDWVSGYLLEDGHVKAMSVDTSVWQPVRNNELAAWLNFTSYPVFAMGKNPYGATIQLDKKFVPGSETASVPDNNPMGNKEEANY